LPLLSLAYDSPLQSFTALITIIITRLVLWGMNRGFNGYRGL